MATPFHVRHVIFRATNVFAKVVTGVRRTIAMDVGFPVVRFRFFFHQLPDVGSLILLAVLVCIIAIGSPGVPGGINMSCSSLVMSIVLATKAPEMGDQFFAVITAI